MYINFSEHQQCIVSFTWIKEKEAKAFTLSWLLIPFFLKKKYTPLSDPYNSSIGFSESHSQENLHSQLWKTTCGKELNTPKSSRNLKKRIMFMHKKGSSDLTSRKWLGLLSASLSSLIFSL